MNYINCVLQDPWACRGLLPLKTLSKPMSDDQTEHKQQFSTLVNRTAYEACHITTCL